jgi:hypothetical protein
MTNCDLALDAADSLDPVIVPITFRFAIFSFPGDGVWCFRPVLDGEVVWGMDPWTWGSGELN